VLRNQILDAEIVETHKNNYATVLTAHATIKTGKQEHRKVKVTVYDNDTVKRFGWIHAEQTFQGIDSVHELRNRAKHELAQRMHPDRTITLSHAGIALVRRGDTMELDIPEFGYKGAKGLVFVSSVSHQVNSSGYSMDLEFSLKDPFKLPSEEKKEALKKKRRAKRQGQN
jgi:hypothetical protein